MSYLKLTPTPTMVRTKIKTLEEVDGVKKASAAVAAVIAVTIAETRQSPNMHLKENDRQSDFQIINYQNWAYTHSIQEDY